MIWLVALALVLGALAALRYRAPAAIAGSALIAIAGIASGLAAWQWVAALAALQLSYFAATLIREARR